MVRRHIVYAELVLQKNKEACDYVAHEVLGAEADGEAGHARARQNGRYIEPAFPQYHDDRDRPDQNRSRLLNDARQSGRTLFHFEVGRFLALLRQPDDLKPECLYRSTDECRRNQSDQHDHAGPHQLEP